MRVLLTNDDGGPNDMASPYIKYLVTAILKYTDWDLTICVPISQKSWIGKAHFAGKDVTVKYIYSSISKPDDNSYHGPFPFPQAKLQANEDLKEWCLVDNGTPATCTDIGVNHICKPENVDLVLSGPNVGRNSTALFALSSGTIGGAMEGCHQGKKAIALSYSYESDPDVPAEWLKEASKISIKIIDQLWNNWNEDSQLYTVNVPLNENVKLGKTKVYHVPMMENNWGTSLFYKTNTEVRDHVDIVDGSISDGVIFRWKPDFDIVHKSVAATTEKSDGKVISQGHASITALRANFYHPAGANEGEMILSSNMQASVIKGILLTNDYKTYRKDNALVSNTKIVVTYPKTSYIYEPLLNAIQKHFPNIKVENAVPPSGDYYVFHYGDYEDLDHERLMMDKKYITNSYIYRKSLIRKHYLSNTIAVYQAKHPESILKTAFPESFQFELTYAEFLDDVLDEVYELRCELMENEKNMNKTFILKPSMTDKGQGIRLFKTIDQLQEIFNSFDEDDTDDEGDETNDGMIISQLRHFVVQEYISNPLLLPNYNDRKFHIRTYVLCTGQINVYVYDRMLLLFSAEKYTNPNDIDKLDEYGIIEMTGHLTNTCLQDQTEEKVVEELDVSCLTSEMKSNIKHQIHLIVADLFKAAVNVDRMNFQPLPNAFESYGLDFLVSNNISQTTGVTLLEVNAYPDFRQTGSELKQLIDEFFEGIMAKAVMPLMGYPVGDAKNFNKVLEIDNL